MKLYYASPVPHVAKHLGKVVTHVIEHKAANKLVDSAIASGKTLASPKPTATAKATKSVARGIQWNIHTPFQFFWHFPWVLPLLVIGAGVGLHYGWKKIELRYNINGSPLAPWRDYVKRIRGIMYYEDKTQVFVKQAFLLRKFPNFIWQKYWKIFTAAVIAEFLVLFFYPNIVAYAFLLPFFLAGLFGSAHIKEVFAIRMRTIMQMFEVADSVMRYPPGAKLNPWGYIQVSSWGDPENPDSTPQVNLYYPGPTYVMYPPKFQSEEKGPRDSFERNFNGTVSDENTWIYEWESSNNRVLCKPVPFIPEKTVQYPFPDKSPWNIFPLGEASGGKEAFFDVSKFPHLLIAGTTGSGKSVTQRTLLMHVLQSPEWRIALVDPKRVELAAYRNHKHVVAVATELEESVELIENVEKEMQGRYLKMQSEQVNFFKNLKSPPPALLLMVDETYALLAPEKIKSDEGKARDEMHARITLLIGSIARLGRAAGVHMILATQRPDAAVIPGETKALALDTPIATPKGWSTMGELSIGDEVFDEQGKIVQVINATETMYNHDCYEVQFSDGSTIVADGGHLWLSHDALYRMSQTRAKRYERLGLDSKPKHKPTLLTTRDMASTLTYHGKTNHAIPVAAKLDVSEQILPVASDTLGTWRGDGSTDNTIITSVESGIIENIKKEGHFVWPNKEPRGATGYHYIVAIKPVESVPVRCISVDSASKLFLAGRNLIPTHNSNLDARIAQGRMDSIPSNMTLDSDRATRIPNIKGRAVLRTGNDFTEFQAYFLPEEQLELVMEMSEALATGQINLSAFESKEPAPETETGGRFAWLKKIPVPSIRMPVLPEGIRIRLADFMEQRRAVAEANDARSHAAIEAAKNASEGGKSQGRGKEKRLGRTGSRGVIEPVFEPSESEEEVDINAIANEARARGIDVGQGNLDLKSSDSGYNKRLRDFHRDPEALLEEDDESLEFHSFESDDRDVDEHDFDEALENEEPVKSRRVLDKSKHKIEKGSYEESKAEPTVGEALSEISKIEGGISHPEGFPGFDTMDSAPLTFDLNKLRPITIEQVLAKADELGTPISSAELLAALQYEAALEAAGMPIPIVHVPVLKESLDPIQNFENGDREYSPSVEENVPARTFGPQGISTDSATEDPPFAIPMLTAASILEEVETIDEELKNPDDMEVVEDLPFTIPMPSIILPSSVPVLFSTTFIPQIPGRFSSDDKSPDVPVVPLVKIPVQKALSAESAAEQQWISLPDSPEDGQEAPWMPKKIPNLGNVGSPFGGI